MTNPRSKHHQTNIYLYGPSGSGKSTVGRLLTQNLNLPFMDLDLEIETQSDMKIPEIFALDGETGFRVREKRALEGVIGIRESVIALGGGALTIPENRALVAESGKVVLLKAPGGTLLSRLQADPIKRPLIAPSSDQDAVSTAEENLKAYLSRRKEHYDSFPLQVDTEGKSPDEITWEIQVKTGTFHLRAMAGPKNPGYDVRVRSGGLDHLGEMLEERNLKGPVAIVTDENIVPLYSDRVAKSLENAGFQCFKVILQPGESHKTLATISQIWNSFLGGRIERGSTIVALGGGVVGDLAGFAAATFLRGISWVAVPTSLLAMVDACMGGKTGADLPQGKNLIGAFHPPRYVLADPDVLQTLPEVEFTNGMAEVIKHGIIADPDLFERCLVLGGKNDMANLDELVRRGMGVKVQFIEEDPYERGIRAGLNYGHTIGHGVELASDFQIRHGEAVAIGMVLEAQLAEKAGLAAEGISDEIAKALQQLGLPTEIPQGLDRGRIASAIQRDKKVADGIVKFALTAEVGKVRVGIEIEGWEDVILAS
jgi:3-dehydroquinate synthase